MEGVRVGSHGGREGGVPWRACLLLTLSHQPHLLARLAWQRLRLVDRLDTSAAVGVHGCTVDPFLTRSTVGFLTCTAGQLHT
jgi:hypothetical protein